MQADLIFYEQILGAVMDSVMVHDLEGHLLYANENAVRTRGYTKSELMKINMHDLETQEYRNSIEQRIQELLVKEDTIYESAHLCKDKSAIPVEIHSQLFNNNGQKYVISIAKDISERKQMESLRKIEERYNAIFDNSFDFLYIHDMEGKFIDANTTTLNRLGYSREETKHMNITSVVVDYQVPKVWRYIEHIKSGKRRNEQVEFKVRCKNGDILDVEIKVAVIHRDGKPFAIIGIGRDITQRKQIEEQLRESEKRFHELADLLPVVTFEADSQGALTYINNLAFDLFGHKSKECKGQYIFDYIAPEDRERSLSNNRRLLAGESIGSNEYMAIREDGHSFPVLIQSSAIINDQGESTGFRGVLVDISKQKQTEDELRQSELKFRALFEQSQEGIILMDSQGKVIGWNSVEEQLSGVKREETLGEYLWEVSKKVKFKEQGISNSRPELDAEIRRIIRTRRSPLLNKTTELKLLTVDGSIFYCLSVLVLIELGNDFMIALILKDITQLKQSQKALQESEEKYRSLVQNMNLGIFRTTIDTKGKVLEFNHAFEEITGYSRSKLMDLEVRTLYANPDERSNFIKQMLETPEKINFETYFIKKDGTKIVVSITAKAIQDESGKLLYFDGILEDITERKMMEERLIDLYEQEKKQRQELQEEAKARGLFIEVLGHELRTPLTPLLVSAGMLQNTMCQEVSQAQRKLIKNILDGSHTLAQRLEELLDLARYSRGTFKLQIQQVEIRNLINEVVSRFKPTIEQCNQKLIVEISSDLNMVKVDPSRLEQVLVNLLSNASKFSPANDEIILRATNRDGALLIEVIDHGVGISPEEQVRLFQPYHRIEQDRHKFPGLGLGLAVCKQIVEAHGGQIWINSKLGQGSTFGLRIPAILEPG